MRSCIAQLTEQQQLLIPGAVTHAAAAVHVGISVHKATLVASRMVYLVALGDGDEALGGEAAGDGRAADCAEASLAEGAARLDPRPGHDADEAEVI